MKKLLPILTILLFPFFLFAKTENITFASIAGTMDQTPQTYCQFDTIFILHNGDASLDAGDLLRFVIHDGSGTSLGNIFSFQGDINSQFGFTSQMDLNQTYFLSAIAGEDDGTGNVDLSDPELSVAQGTPLNFLESPDPSISSSGQLDCVSTSVGLSVDAICAGCTYLWSNSQSGQFITVNTAGTYVVTVTGANGCTAVGAITVTQSTNLPTVNINTSGILDCNTNCITVEAFSGGSFSYDWSTGQNTPIIDVCFPGTYTLTITDVNNGCTATQAVTIIENIDIPIANAGPDMTLNCIAPSVVLDGSNSSAGSNITYEWIDANGAVIGNTPTIITTVPGTYTLVITDASNGCTAISQVLVFEDIIIPNADAGPDMEIDCNNPQVALDGTSSTIGTNMTYQWTTLDGNILSGETTLQPTVNNEGTYQLEVWDTQNGCSASDEVVVTFTGTGAFGFSLEDDTYFDCTASEMVLAAINPPTGTDFTFLWTTSDGTIISGGNTPNATIGTPGTYVLEVEDVPNNCTGIRQITIYDIDEIITVTPNITLSCGPNALTTINATTLLPGGNFTYQWTTADGNIASSANTLNPAVDIEGTYELLVTDDDNGCTTSATVVVGSPTFPTITIDASNGGVITCNDPTITLEAVSVAGAYLWSIGSTATTITVNAVGTYEVTVTDFNGCSATENYIVTADIDFIESTLPDTLSLNCSNAFTAEIGATLTDPNANASYIWEGENNFLSMDSSIIVMEGMEGYYLLGITNEDNGCQDYDTLVVVNDGFSIDVATTLANCDQTDGTATATTALTNTTTMWSTGDQGPTVSNLAQGWYSVTVTDQNNNCDRHTNFFIDEDTSCKVVISGYVVNDPNNTCTYDATMEGIECVMVKLDPLGIFTLTDATGYYEFIVDDGSYTVDFIGSPEVELQCPTSGTYDVTLNTNGTISDANHFYVLRKDTDLCISKFSGNARPGLDQFNCVQVCNFGMNTTDAVVTFTHDPIFSDQTPWPVVIPAYNNAYAGDYTYDAATNTFTWNLTDMAPGDCIKIMWFMTVPQSAQVGDILFTEAKVNPIATDLNPANNCLAWELQVTGSYDPNDKRNFVGENQWGGAIYEDDTTMEYAIRFQNVGNDTAFTVVIRDTLDAAHLDVTSIRAFTASHDMEVQFEDNNVLIFRFENIMLVDSTTNEPGSNGWVSFDIDRKPNQPFGTEIKNQAAIYFDFNDPVITNEVLNTLTEPTSLFSPSENEIQVTVIPTVTKNKIQLNYTLENSSPLSIRLYNTEGVWLQNFDFKNQQAGEHQMELDLERFSAGVYFIFIETEEGKAVRRVVKI